MDPGRVVVVGAGLGGLTVVEQLRRAGHTGPVALVGEEAEHPYDRPPLSKEVLRGEHEAPRVLREHADYDELDLDLRLGRAAVALDPGSRRVHLDDGQVLPYDTVVLAPGATPRTLPGAAALAGVHVLRTASDARALRDDVLRERSLVVVGGGPLGCEVAASARATGARVDLVELLDGPLVRVLGPVLAARVARLHEEAGVRLHVGRGVVAVRGQDRVRALELSDGTVLPARVVLVALGVLPATGWLAGAGLELGPDGAVHCDRTGQACLPGTWALGDAAAWQDATGGRRRVEHWTSAVEQASTVAANLLAEPGERQAHAGLPYFWSDQYDSTLQAVGEVAPQTEAEVHEVDGGLVALHAADERLLGVVAFDARRQVGRARKLLRAGSGLAAARAALLR